MVAKTGPIIDMSVHMSIDIHIAMHIDIRMDIYSMCFDIYTCV